MDLLDYAHGLEDLLHGQESYEAEAAACNVAEVLLLWRAYLRAKAGLKD